MLLLPPMPNQACSTMIVSLDSSISVHAMLVVVVVSPPPPYRDS